MYTQQSASLFMGTEKSARERTMKGECVAAKQTVYLQRRPCKLFPHSEDDTSFDKGVRYTCNGILQHIYIYRGPGKRAVQHILNEKFSMLLQRWKRLTPPPVHSTCRRYD